MAREPETDAERIKRFVSPVGVVLTDRADVLARIYAGVMASGKGFQEERIIMARRAVDDFLRMLDDEPPEPVTYKYE